MQGPGQEQPRYAYVPGNDGPVDLNAFRKTPEAYLAQNGVTMEEMDRPGVRDLNLGWGVSLNSNSGPKEMAGTINANQMTRNDIEIVIKHTVHWGGGRQFQELLALQLAITKYACHSLSSDDIKNLSTQIDSINFPDTPKPADDENCCIS